MCGRFDFHGETDDITALIEVVGSVDAQAQHYNLAPTQQAMAAHAHVADETLRLGPMRFGMPAHTRGGLVLNARAETAAQKPMFKTALARRRCLVFANGFYEWRATNAGKQPYYFAVEDMPVFAFAALYTASPDAGASFVIITTEANPAVAPLHHRMPVIVPKAHLTTWLSPATRIAEAEGLLVPYAGAMRIYPVATKVNSPRHTGADCITPIVL